jgi:hypothetical protein
MPTQEGTFNWRDYVQEDGTVKKSTKSARRSKKHYMRKCKPRITKQQQAQKLLDDAVAKALALALDEDLDDVAVQHDSGDDLDTPSSASEDNEFEGLPQYAQAVPSSQEDSADADCEQDDVSNLN